ncbi:hypothetical protein NHX12_022228 [Muraenolepis orangiensis]|uniref:Tight junction-associated protein 1 domain-containing protein n=1 Tax=Muraenolepis orangiensis TaxID=630683 RepID=A0A9Q0ITB1_9TELE|nr:hypothetical protein NHX12_022228 [Muraenolepis orangiensis]
MTSSAPGRKPYRRAPPQHRETRPPPHVYTGTEQPPGPPPPPPPMQSSHPDAGKPPHYTLQGVGCSGHRGPSRWAPSSDSDPQVSGLSSPELPPPSTSSTSTLGVPASGGRWLAGRWVEWSGSVSPTLSFREEVQILSPDHGRPSRGPRAGTGPPKSILKQPGRPGVRRDHDPVRKSKSAELLDGNQNSSRGQAESWSLAHPGLRTGRRSSLRGLASSSSLALEEKVKFSGFLDEITCRVLSPAHLRLLGRKQPSAGGQSAARRLRPERPWDEWASSLERPPRPDRRATPTSGQSQDGVVHAGLGSWPIEEVLVSARTGEGQGGRPRQQENKVCERGLTPTSPPALLHLPGPPPLKPPPLKPPPLLVLPGMEAASDAERIRVLQQQNDELHRCLSHSNRQMESVETEFENSRRYMQTEMSRTQDDLDKMRDKLQNSYTASQRANQDLEEKLHALAAVSQTWVHALRKVERDKKTMDQEIVELTNKLLDAKNTVNRLEELNERYRLDCNLAVQLLKCNKSHFRNHKFSDLPSELQVMVQRHMKSSLPEAGGASSPGPQEPDTLSLTPTDVVPTSIIARVLEKPEPLVLNSAQSCSTARPASEDVFVHVDMTGHNGHHNGSAGRRTSPDTPLTPGGGRGAGEEAGGGGRGGNSSSSSSFEKLNPYPAPPPPHPLYPGRKVIEFTSDDKVRIPKNSPLPNCTYATRQAISLSLVQADAPPSPAHSDSGWRSASASSSSSPPGPRPQAPARGRDVPSGGSSPFSSPPPRPPSSASSEEDLLLSWQRMFVQKEAPPAALHQRTAFGRDSAHQLGGASSVGGGATERQRGGGSATYSDGEEGSSAPSWTASRESSLDTDSSSVADPRPSRESHRALPLAGPDERLGDPVNDGAEDNAAAAIAMTTHGEPLTPTPAPTMNRKESPREEEGREEEEEDDEREEEEREEEGSVGSWAEERDVLPRDLPVIAPTHHLEYPTTPPPPPAPPGRGQKNPKRMGVHHLHRKDSLTRAQEQGTLLD